MASYLIRNIILTGFMGTGKSVVGKRLARHLKRRFIDTDTLIEQEAGVSIAQIFATEGEPAFRKRERQAITRICQEENIVMATGGGAVMDAGNARMLKESGLVICLTARPEVILQRLHSNTTSRPLLQGPKPLEKIQNLMADRADAYAKADLSIDTSCLGPDAVVEAALVALSEKSHAA